MRCFELVEDGDEVHAEAGQVWRLRRRIEVEGRLDVLFVVDTGVGGVEVNPSGPHRSRRL